MWTRVDFESYVPPGYDDSGWDKMTVYITAIVQKENLMPIIKQALLTTEVTKGKNFEITYVEPFQPKWYQIVVTQKGEWAGC